MALPDGVASGLSHVLVPVSDRFVYNLWQKQVLWVALR